MSDIVVLGAGLAGTLAAPAADFGFAMMLPAFRGVAFVAQPQIPPRNANWSAKGAWMHLAKVGFEEDFLYETCDGESGPFYERFLLRQLDIHKPKSLG